MLDQVEVVRGILVGTDGFVPVKWTCNKFCMSGFCDFYIGNFCDKIGNITSLCLNICRFVH